MPAYNATFRTYTHYADLDIEAATPEQALWKSMRACGFTTGRRRSLFHSYECAGSKDVNEIEVRDADGKTLQLRLDDDVALRNAAAELRDALEALVEPDRAEAAAPHQGIHCLIAHSGEDSQTAHPVACRARFPAPGPRCRPREGRCRSRTQRTNRPPCLDFFSVLSRPVAASALLSAQRP